MTAFVAVAALMAAAACAWVLIPLLREHRKDDIDRHASNLAILRDQLRELQAERARGLLGDAQYEQSRGELERRVLEEATVALSDSGPVPRAGAWAAATLGALLPMGAVVLYLALGNPEAVSVSAQGEMAAHSKQALTQQDIEAMVGRLAERLEREPDNAEGWMMLGRSYNAMNRHPEAARAYERAVALLPDHADVLADYADTLAMTQGRSLQGKPLQMIERALELDPKHWKALALAGTVAFDRKDYNAAVGYWERMKDSVPPGSEIARSIDSSIAEARTLGAIDRPATVTVGAPKSGPATDPPLLAATVAGVVRLAPTLAAKAAPEDTVYIFARAADGPRMPLAILRKQVKDLPVTFALDDTMAMSEAAKLSGFVEVVVGARVSKTGDATPRSGDLEGTSLTVKIGTKDIAVVIDGIRP
jgi:cytochrome c-type biogenesis protein CcmH